MKKNKKGLVLTMVVKIIVIAIMITLIANIFLNKNFYDDTLDFILNLFEPPEIDPLPSATRMLIARENAFDYLALWVEAFDEMKLSDQPYCYRHIPEASRESRDEKLAITFFTTQQDSFEIRLSQQQAAVSRNIQIDAPFCLIAQPSNADTTQSKNILKNFRDAFYSNDQNKINSCLQNPQTCSMEFSNPSFYSNDYANHESFYAEFTINSEEKSTRRTSFSTLYTMMQNDEQKIILNGNSGILSDAGYLLFKINDNLCIMPLANSWRRCEPFLVSNSRRGAGINILRRYCFFDKSFEPNSRLERIPECKPTVILTDEEAQEQAKEYILQRMFDTFNVKIKEEHKEPDLDAIFRTELEFIFDNGHWRIWANNSYYPVGEPRIYEQINYEVNKFEDLKPYDERIMNTLRQFTTTLTREQGLELAITFKDTQPEIQTTFPAGTFQSIVNKFKHGQLP